MNRNGAIIATVIALVVVGGIAYSVTSGPKSTTAVDVDGSGNTSGANTPKAGIPKVTTIETSFPSDTTAVVTGTIIPNGSLTSYWYEYGPTSDIKSRFSSQMIGSGFASLNAPAYLTQLSKNTTYYFRLVAENEFGKVAGDMYTFKTTSGVSAPVGSAPLVKTLVANGISKNTANLNGEVTPNKADTEYWFEYGKTANLGDITEFSSVGNGSVKVPISISVSNLTEKTTYYYRINAQNKFGTVNGAIQNFQTLDTVTPSMPTARTIDAVAVNSSSATLRGDVNPNGRETKYWFEYSKDSALGKILLKETERTVISVGTDAVAVRADIASLSSSTTYYFRLVAENNLGKVVGEKLTFKTK